MREVTKEIFKINELSNAAKETAYYKWLDHGCYYHSDENKETMNKFADIFNIDILHWEYDYSSYHYRFDLNHDDEVQELSGVRLLKYLWNNYKRDIYKGKYYSLWSKKEKSEHRPNDKLGKLKSRYSKIMIQSDTCPLTGVWIDHEILQPIQDFMNHPDDRTFYDLMDDCLDSFFKACQHDFNHCTSMEYFMEEAECNDYEYYENGNMY